MVVGYNCILSRDFLIVKGGIFLYTAQNLVNNIKQQAKEKDISLKDILDSCDLNVNSLSQMTDKKGLASFSLAKIADCLNCSTDYLLGRTSAPEQPMQFQTTKEQQLIAAYKAHPELQPAIDKLLGIDEVTVYAAARSSSDQPPHKVKMSKAKIQKALADDSIKDDSDL